MTMKTIDPKAALNWLKSGEAILIDVREADEFKTQHIPYALSMPLGGVCEAFRMLEFAPQTHKKVIFQCQKGGRGGQACVMVDAELTAQEKPQHCPEIYNLEGGITAWAAAGLPVINSVGAARCGISIFRQVQIIVGGLVFLSVLAGLFITPSAFVLAGLFGVALMVAGLTGWCGLALLLAKMPWNNAAKPEEKRVCMIK